MSGGFFRGTSAEQDTRFSNKQAKLLKTQKFAPEMDHLVDITKVKMDVIKPWIAKRVTELLGFEDEVLINYINGLLEGKDINGKQIQIQLTGFMEKHTGKFMKELWSLLLSAQNNASGVPQQFLDAKEEETRKKKEEMDRIEDEMQKRREKGSRESELVDSKMDGGVIDDSTMDPNSKYVLEKNSKVYSDDEKEAAARNGFRGRSRASRSPKSADRFLSPHRATSRAISKSYSNSRSYSEERNRSRNMSSRSPPSRQHSVSSERRYCSPQRSLSPIRRNSPNESLSPRRRSPKQRSTSRSHYRPSPARRGVRSPVRRRSPSPGRRRSRSLQHRSRSPRRCRSPSPSRRRSPSLRRRRSPSPRRRRPRSPRRRHSPPWRRRSPSPRRRQSPSPLRRHQRRSLTSSPSPVRRRPPSPPSRHRSPFRHRSPSTSRGRSPSLRRHRSPPPLKRRSPSPSRARSLSPVSGSRPVKRRVPVSAHLRSPNQLDRSSSPHSQVSSSPVRHRSSSPSEGDLPTLKKDPLQYPSYKLRIRDQCSPSYHHVRKERNATLDEASEGRDIARRITSKYPHSKDQSPSEDREDKAYKHNLSQKSVRSPRHKNMDTPEKSSGEHNHDDINLRKKEKEIKREKMLTKEAIGLNNTTDDISSSLEKPAVLSPPDELKEGKAALWLMKKDDLNSPSLDSAGSERSDMHRAIVTNKRKHRKSSRRQIGSESTGDDSDVEDRKEAKRRRKEEKKLRKEERKHRREEKRWRKEEKRAHKRRSKDRDTMSSDSDKHENNVNASGGDRDAVQETYLSYKEETESEKKRHEIELREQALQNIRAKKGISH